MGGTSWWDALPVGGANLAAVSPVAVPLLDLFMTVPEPEVASRPLELGASSFYPLLHFIAEETVASGVRQGLDLLIGVNP